MKITDLRIQNFRGISRVEATNLGDTIIIAGQNGSGKSCIFDAIRLLKSTYGGYQQNEWQNFFGEFQIQLTGDAENMRGLFNDSAKPCRISCTFQLREREKAYISGHAAQLLEETIWQSLVPEAFQWGGYRKALFAQQFRDRQPEVKARVQAELPSLMAELSRPNIGALVEVSPSGEVLLQQSRLISVVFSNYRPRQIGVIDFHGAQRHYGRERVQGINLNLDQASQNQSAHSLYNYNNKYNNVKSEMAGNFIKELLAERAGAMEGEGTKSLTATLQELFESFFPDKKFLGPRPTSEGSLSFPVLTQSGAEHDLDELSSGEKEILYGYLRIRSSAPRDSIILLDEPELHLNPRLIRGLPEFYRKHLGEALQNQLWLVTHSDALIREAVGKPGFNVFHMLPCGTEGAMQSQLRTLSVSEDLELALTDLVGDLAAYRPGGKGLIFEGGGDSDFDKTFVSALFPDELRGINLLSGTNRVKVRALHEILDRAYSKGELPTKFYAIVDRDSDEQSTGKAVNRFTWPVYHVENYLLDDNIIADVLNSVDLLPTWNAESVGRALREAATAVVPAIVAHKMRVHINAGILGCLDLGFSPKAANISEELHGAVLRSCERLNSVLSDRYSRKSLESYEMALRAEIDRDFASGDWRESLPGREILRQLVRVADLKVGYEIFRNLLVSKMVERGHKPVSMKVIIDQIRAG